MILLECAPYIFFLPNKKKCERYWPEKPGQRFVCEPFTVYCVSIISIHLQLHFHLRLLSIRVHNRSGLCDFRCCLYQTNSKSLSFSQLVEIARKTFSCRCFFLTSQDSEENKADYLSRTLRVTFSNVGILRYRCLKISCCCSLQASTRLLSDLLLVITKEPSTESLLHSERCSGKPLEISAPCRRLFFSAAEL